MEEIIVLDLEVIYNGVIDSIHPVVIKDDKNIVLIDTGYTGFLDNIERALAQNHINKKDITHVIITHHDHDHMGCLAAMKKKYPNIKIIASEKETPYISGDIKSPRLIQAEELQEKLPKAQKSFGEMFIEIIRNVENVNVDIKVHGGDVLDICGGLEIIETTGHTDGHISVLMIKQNTLISGDAAVIENGRLEIANPKFTLDMNQAKSSLDKIVNMNADLVICFHGGVYNKMTK